MNDLQFNFQFMLMKFNTYWIHSHIFFFFPSLIRFYFDSCSFVFWFFINFPLQSCVSFQNQVKEGTNEFTSNGINGNKFCVLNELSGRKNKCKIIIETFNKCAI